MKYLREQMGSATFPVLSIDMFVRQNYNAQSISSKFQSIAKDIMDVTPIASVITNIAVRGVPTIAMATCTGMLLIGDKVFAHGMRDGM